MIPKHKTVVIYFLGFWIDLKVLFHVLSARVILVAVFRVKVQEDLSHVTGALMLTWLQCTPLSRKWPFQQESLDLLCGGCGGKSRKKSRQVSSTLHL